MHKSDNGVVDGWLRSSIRRKSMRKSPNGNKSDLKPTNMLSQELGNVDPSAAFHTFRKHWQQTHEIIQRTNSKTQASAL